MDNVYQNYQKILVVKLRFHGDMLLTTPLISTLKMNYPDAQIDVLLYEDTMPILSENKDINVLYGIKRKEKGALRKLKSFSNLARKLRANHYDLIINLTDQWLIAPLLKLANARKKISLEFRHRDSFFWRFCFDEIVRPVGSHVVEHNLSVANALHLSKIDMHTIMAYDEKQWETIHNQLITINADKKYIVIQPTARQIFKCWDNDKFADVIDNIQSNGLNVILTSGPSEEDQQCINAISALCKSPPITDFACKTTFPQLAALIDHAELFIGVDSAPMHMAAALETPIVCLFGATDHLFWRPWSENKIVIWAGDYQTMPQRSGIDRQHKYLSCIPATDVIEAALTMLSKTRQASQSGTRQ
ncbi:MULTISPECIES: lipopolysaccharide core heptosyltransferase RfaQ [unclassified Brenneria]|uniref:lipopolysaccharide core heptosyltransferase RfaQ n=1 Tax=unclassified Brenneria TaxID=2634434 RepID=UPI0018F0E56B|nr:lipopolysaccharide core heptosyltransferase RfaQ [Brenneria sp. L3-3C-1]MEE3644648.1 lipopolysaccharide core heptosyltransferase RfaQ [Brenneria sp. L3_3C_1]